MNDRKNIEISISLSQLFKLLFFYLKFKTKCCCTKYMWYVLNIKSMREIETHKNIMNTKIFHEFSFLLLLLIL